MQGLGTLGGFKLKIEDRAALGYDALDRGHQGLHRGKARQRLNWADRSRNYQVNVPQLDVDLDRVKAKQLGVPVTDVFDTHADLPGLGCT